MMKTLINGANGLRIVTVDGRILNPSGPVTYKVFEGERVYYCGGSSWPQEIVEEILMDEREAI